MLFIFHILKEKVNWVPHTCILARISFMLEPSPQSLLPKRKRRVVVEESASKNVIFPDDLCRVFCVYTPIHHGFET